MYKDFFKLVEQPFSIVPSSRYIFLSERHREAMHYLQSGLGNGGGFALLTGEVGTGKTTLSKVLLSKLGDNVRAGLLLTPTYSPLDLLEAICDEFSLTYPQQATMKQLTQTIHQYLLSNHENGLLTSLVIDEAQHLSSEVLEQLRLLTNLETDTQKLLKVLLIGQPELQHKLQQPHLRQLAQRITARYHLLPLTADEVREYIAFRLQISGGEQNIFAEKATILIAERTQGIPRLVNLVCDKALLYAYQESQPIITTDIARKACNDALYFMTPQNFSMGSNVDLQSQPEIATEAPSEALSHAERSESNKLDDEAKPNFHLPREWVWYGGSLLLGVFVALFLWLLQPKIKSSDVLAHQSTLPTNNTEEMIEPLIARSNNTIKAMNDLISVWGYKVRPNEGDCRHLSQINLYCYQDKGSIDDLIVINRPALLTMRAQHRTYFAVLYKLSDNYAHLLLADEHLRVPRQWLEDNWGGEYQLLWHSPIKNRELSLHDRDEEVQDLVRNLARALGDDTVMPYVYGEVVEFDTNVQRKLEAFQKWQGLDVTGVLNEATLMLLDSVSNYDAPVLIYTDPLDSLPSTKEGA